MPAVVKYEYDTSKNWPELIAKVGFDISEEDRQSKAQNIIRDIKQVIGLRSHEKGLEAFKEQHPEIDIRGTED